MYQFTSEIGQHTGVAYMSDGEQKITLIGMQHVGSQYYYDNCFSLANRRDVVLYEKSNGWIKSLKNSLKLISQEHTQRFLHLISNALNKLPERRQNNIKDPYRFMVVPQSRAINYDAPPAHWHNADLTVDQICDEVPFLSRDHWDYASAFLFTQYFTLRGQLPEQYARDFLEPLEINHKNAPRVQALREQQVFDALKKTKEDNVAIMYGTNHMPDIELHLRRRGFKRDEMKYLDAILF